MASEGLFSQTLYAPSRTLEGITTTVSPAKQYSTWQVNWVWCVKLAMSYADTVWIKEYFNFCQSVQFEGSHDVCINDWWSVIGLSENFGCLSAVWAVSWSPLLLLSIFLIKTCFNIIWDLYTYTHISLLIIIVCSIQPSASPQFSYKVSHDKTNWGFCAYVQYWFIQCEHKGSCRKTD